MAGRTRALGSPRRTGDTVPPPLRRSAAAWAAATQAPATHRTRPGGHHTMLKRNLPLRRRRPGTRRPFARRRDGVQLHGVPALWRALGLRPRGTGASVSPGRPRPTCAGVRSSSTSADLRLRRLLAPARRGRRPTPDRRQSAPDRAGADREGPRSITSTASTPSKTCPRQALRGGLLVLRTARTARDAAHRPPSRCRPPDLIAWVLVIASGSSRSCSRCR